MTDTTTIEIREDQRDELKALKEHEKESYKAVLDRLLDGVAEERTDGMPEGVCEQLDRIESSAVAVEERTGEMQRVLEGLQR